MSSKARAEAPRGKEKKERKKKTLRFRDDAGDGGDGGGATSSSATEDEKVSPKLFRMEGNEAAEEEGESGWSQSSQIGKTLGSRSVGKFGLGAHLRFQRVLGEGSEGQTWLCEDLETREKVAAKVIERQDHPASGGGSGRAKHNGRHHHQQQKHQRNKKKARKVNPSRVAAEIIMQVSAFPTLSTLPLSFGERRY